MPCSSDKKISLETAEKYVREAAAAGAKIILLPELFERQYFCQERRYDYYDFAEPVLDNEAVKMGKRLAEELDVVLPISFYEKDVNNVYNSVAVIDAGGEYLGIYRKTHIPDDHYYQEKFYFTPGDTGFKAFNTKYGVIGVGICWDQWFPECARSMALLGAEILLYPTAIGSEPILECDSSGHWRRVMQGHAAANLMPVIAANRIGTEKVEPSEENGGQRSELTFYGSSFISDATGEIVESMDKEREGILVHEFDLDALQKDRLSWGLFRDRRPEMYGEIIK
ncbi:MAG: N-carbamoylputrescine amidase [Acetatifactor sp.]|nr:N-carbamoylputrescine amidase [Acetatifactor sp.]